MINSRIAFFINTSKPNALFHAKNAALLLKKSGFRVYIPSRVANTLPDSFSKLDLIVEGLANIKKNVDIAVVFGGDGTIISAARDLVGSSIPILGINSGTMGFLAEIGPNDFEEYFKRIIKNDYLIDLRMMINVEVTRPDSKGKYKSSTIKGSKEIFFALNDAVINRESFARVLDFKVSVDSREVDKYRGDGVIISTPTGSTGYSLSAGGPVIHPNIDVILVTPICAHRLHTRSVVVSGKQTVSVAVMSSAPARLTLDGQQTQALKGDEIIHISRSSHITRLITFPDKNFYSVLNAKLVNG
jgi:NAD+ kinase